MIDPARRAPSPQTLEWVRRQVGSDAKIGRVRRLLGGVSSSVHAVAVTSGSGATTSVVLRRWIGDWIDDQPDLRAQFVDNECRALAAASRGDVPAPRLIAADATGTEAGASAVLMTRVPGRVNLDPVDVDGWLRAQAELLPRVHAIEADVPRSRPPDFAAWEGPRRTRRPDLWRAVKDVLCKMPPDSVVTFRHGDYQHFNMMWSRGRLTGIVDWTFPRRGPPDLDVCHCQLNLGVLYSSSRAEHFRELYESVAGRRVDPWWNLAALTRYGDDWVNFIPVQVNRLIPVDTNGMTDRVEEIVAATLRRLG